MTLAESLATYQAEYLECADYDVTADVGKCRRFIAACRRLLLLTPTRSASTGSETELDPALIRSQLEAAQVWLDAYQTAADGSCTLCNLEDFRE